MKKNVIIWGTALVLVIMAIYVTHYYKGSGNNLLQDPTTQSQDSTTQNISSQPGSGPAVTASEPSSAVVQKALDFTVSDLSGKSVSLSDYKGKYVYLNFWATWCPPCKGEMPDLEKVYEKYKDKGLVVLAVDLGEDGDTVSSFISQNKYSFKVLLDSDRTAAAEYGISAIPTSFFIDKAGNIVDKRIGALTSNEMQAYVKKLINK